MAKRILIGVFSGLTYSGKSFFRDWVMALPEFKRARLVAMDNTRERLWPGRADAHITATEHVFKNETTRFEVKTMLIVEKPSALFLEMVMLTRAAHQRPFVEMIGDANRYLQIIEREEAKRDEAPAPEKPIEVDFRCVYFYCDLATVRRRIEYRRREREIGNLTDTGVLNLEGFYRSARQIELPEDYVPLLVNTSDETPEALTHQHGEILSFLRGEMPISKEESTRRAAEAAAILESFRA